MRTAFAGGLALAVLAAAQAASTAPSANEALVSFTGIGKLRLGMSKAAARKALHQRGRLSRRIAIRPGVEYVEYEYRRDFTTAYALGFIGSPARQRLVQIRTWWWQDRTREGVRIGTTERRVRAAYRERLTCGVSYGTHGGTEVCRLRSTRGHLIILLRGVPIVHGRVGPDRVTSMVVRDPDLRLSILLPGE